MYCRPTSGGIGRVWGPRGVPDDYLSPLNMDRVSALTGRPAERAPQDAVGADWPLGDMRCSIMNACASRREGRRGALLARKVSAAEVRCNQCGETTVIAPGETIRDDTDLSDALDQELTKRLVVRFNCQLAPLEGLPPRALSSIDLAILEQHGQRNHHYHNPTAKPVRNSDVAR